MSDIPKHLQGEDPVEQLLLALYNIAKGSDYAESEALMPEGFGGDSALRMRIAMDWFRLLQRKLPPNVVEIERLLAPWTLTHPTTGTGAHEETTISYFFSAKELWISPTPAYLPGVAPEVIAKTKDTMHLLTQNKKPFLDEFRGFHAVWLSKSGRALGGECFPWGHINTTKHIGLMAVGRSCEEVIRRLDEFGRVHGSPLQEHFIPVPPEFLLLTRQRAEADRIRQEDAMGRIRRLHRPDPDVTIEDFHDLPVEGLQHLVPEPIDPGVVPLFVGVDGEAFVNPEDGAFGRGAGALPAHPPGPPFQPADPPAGRTPFRPADPPIIDRPPLRPEEPRRNRPWYPSFALGLPYSPYSPGQSQPARTAPGRGGTAQPPDPRIAEVAKDTLPDWMIRALKGD